MTAITSVDVPLGATSYDTQSSPVSEIGPKPTHLDPTTSKIFSIIGAGTFGLSTAYHLQEDGFRDVVVLDRAVELPARDTASTDINKGVYHVTAQEFLSSQMHTVGSSRTFYRVKRKPRLLLNSP